MDKFKKPIAILIASFMLLVLLPITLFADDEENEQILINSFDILDKSIINTYTGESVENLVLPNKLFATHEYDTKIEIDVEKWKIKSHPKESKILDENKFDIIGDYTLSPVIPKKYELKEDLTLPEITIRVSISSNNQQESSEDTAQKNKNLDVKPKAEPVCAIGNLTYSSLDDALSSINYKEKKTIKLLSNIHYNKTLKLAEDISVIFDLNNYDLIIVATGIGIDIVDSNINYIGKGNFNIIVTSNNKGKSIGVYPFNSNVKVKDIKVSGGKRAYGICHRGLSKVTANNVSVSGGFKATGVFSDYGSTIINGNITVRQTGRYKNSECYGADVSSFGDIELYGNITTYSNAAKNYAISIKEGWAEIYGNVSTYCNAGENYGIDVYEGGIEIYGNIFVNGNNNTRAMTGINADTSHVYVKKNITVTGKAKKYIAGIEISANSNECSEITVDGEIKTKGIYIDFYFYPDKWIEKRINDYDNKSEKKGYIQYSELVKKKRDYKNYVWVKGSAPSRKGGAKTRDNNNIFLWSILSLTSFSTFGALISRKKKFE